MSAFNRSEFVDCVLPLDERLNLYDPTRPPTDQPKNDAADITEAVPQAFIDAMIVREKVFVEEQGVPLKNELDEDDERSFHWVAYASIPITQSAEEEKANGRTDAARRGSASTKVPIGTIRLVPPPHQPYHQGKEGAARMSKESYVKLGRLAVIKEFRKAGISKLLIETALAFAREHPYDLVPPVDPTTLETKPNNGISMDFRGLVLIHAQTGVQKVWRKYGFETDESMGTWIEEGIEHVGMWKRMDVSDGRRRSKMWLPSRPSNT